MPASAYIPGALAEDFRSSARDLFRKNMSATATREDVVLELEGQAARLLDQIEHFARLPNPTEVTRH